MRKKTVFAVAMAVSVMMAGAVSAESTKGEDITGEWYLVNMAIGNGDYSPSSFGLSVTMTLDEDGSASIVSNGETSIGTWDAKKNVINVDGENKFEVDGDKLILKEAGGDEINMVFGRDIEEASTTAVGDVIENPDIADFNGTWNAESIVFNGIPMPLNMLGMEETLVIKDGEITYHQADNTEDDHVADTLDFTMKGELEGNTLTMNGGKDEGYKHLALKLHDGGSMTDGYEEVEDVKDTDSTESAEEIEEETEVEDEYSGSPAYILFVKAE